MPAKEYRFLMNNKNEMSFEELHDLLIDNEVKNFDPVAEAFKVYDPENSGFVDTEVLRSIFESLGFGEITDDGARARAPRAGRASCRRSDSNAARFPALSRARFADLAILVETGDVDGDGKISLTDFRHMLDFNKTESAPSNQEGDAGS